MLHSKPRKAEAEAEAEAYAEAEAAMQASLRYGFGSPVLQAERLRSGPLPTQTRSVGPNADSDAVSDGQGPAPVDRRESFQGACPSGRLIA